MMQTTPEDTSPVRGRLLLLASILILTALFTYLDLIRYLDLNYLIEQRTALNNYYLTSPYQTMAAYFITYVVLTAMSLPVSALMMVAGGVIFGLVPGILLASFASAIGSTLAFLCSRYLLKDILERQFTAQLALIKREMEIDGFYYLFMLRLATVIPSFLISLLMGILPISTVRFYLTSQAGMLPATIVCVNAGTQIATITAMSDIMSLRLITAFALVGIFPLLARKTVALIRSTQTRENDEQI